MTAGIISLLPNGEWRTGIATDKIILIDIPRRLQTRFQDFGETFKKDQHGEWLLCDENTEGDWLIVDCLGCAWFGEKYHKEDGDIGAINLNSFGYINSAGEVKQIARSKGCPKCNSTDYSIPGRILDPDGLIQFVCRRCGCLWWPILGPSPDPQEPK